jgi:hypothetical protein
VRLIGSFVLAMAALRVWCWYAFDRKDKARWKGTAKPDGDEDASEYVRLEPTWNTDPDDATLED